MKRLSYAIVALIGLLISYNLNIFQTEKVQATELGPPSLPKIENNFKLDLNLETGKASIESNQPFTKVDANVSYPTKIVEKVVVKYKEKIVYETKTEYKKIFLDYPLPKSKLNIPCIELPKRIEK